MSKGKVRRPQAPKRRNFVAKHAREFQRAEVHRDRSKYDRYEDYLKDQLDSYVDELGDDDDIESKKEEFTAKLKGEEYDPELRKEWEEYQRQQGDPGDDWDDFDYDDWSGTL